MSDLTEAQTAALKTIKNGTAALPVSSGTRLVEKGLAVKRDKSGAGRARAFYAITDAGKAALG